MESVLNEETLESLALAWFSELGYEVKFSPDIAPGEPGAERDSYEEVLLPGTLRVALERLNPHLPPEALDEVIRKLRRSDFADLVMENRRLHRFITEGVPVEFRDRDGNIRHDYAKLVDFSTPENNDWLVLNQFTVIENRINRRADVVVFLNGIPVALMELKSPSDETAKLGSAFNQIETYKAQIPSLFRFNEVVVLSDG